MVYAHFKTGGVIKPSLRAVQTISARRWKLEMGLNGKGKDGSRELAVQLFPHAADMLKCAMP